MDGDGTCLENKRALKSLGGPIPSPTATYFAFGDMAESGIAPAR